MAEDMLTEKQNIKMPSFLDYVNMSENKKTYLKMKMLCEDGDEKAEKDAPINKDMLNDFGQQLMKASSKYAKQMTKTVIEKLASIVKIDTQKLFENSAMKKILDMLEKIFTPDSSESLTPITVVYYQSTDVYLGLYLKTKKGIFKKIFGMMTSMLGNSPFQVLFVPFNMEGGKPKLATSGDAITQMCMTIFLSDIDCDVVWPFKMKSNWFIKALDFICPSLIDLLSLVTFGSASVAGRLAKYGTKAGVKVGKSVAKKVTKAAAKAGAKVGGKTGAKVAKKLAKSGLDKAGKKLSKLTKVGKKAGKSAGEKAFDKAVGKLPKGMQKKAKNLKKMAGTSRKAKEFIRQKRDEKSDAGKQNAEKQDAGNSEQKVDEGVGIKNNEIYLQNMSKSFGDKAWFLKMIRPEIDTIVDFGGGAGEFCEFIRDKVGRPIKFVIIDNNQDFKAQAEAKGFTVFESLDQLMSWEQFNPSTSLLNMSSVIHEIYSYADDFYDDVGYFWSQVGKCQFRQVAIRDMSMNENSYRTAPTDAILWVYENVFRNGGLTVKGVPLSEIMQSFENVWGEICDLKTRRVDVKNLVHFLIKYRYVENWEREVEENYLPVSQDKLANILTSAGYKFSHKESSKLDFYAKTWDKDFKLRIPDNDGYREIFSRWLKTLSTHIKWMLEHS